MEGTLRVQNTASSSTLNQVAVDMTLTRLGLQTVLIGRNDIAQVVNQVANPWGETTQALNRSRDAVPTRRSCCRLLTMAYAMGCSLAAMDMTMDCITQEDSSQGHTVR